MSLNGIFCNPSSAPPPHRRTIADLQRLVEELQRAQPSRDLLEREAAEKVSSCSVSGSLKHIWRYMVVCILSLTSPLLSSLPQAQLRSQLAALRKALGNKEEETGRLGQTLSLKDETIRDLQEQLERAEEQLERAEEERERAEEEREREAERARELQVLYCHKDMYAVPQAEEAMDSRDAHTHTHSHTHTHTQGEVAGLQSQGRIAQLSSDDLQARLTDAYREREELARRLREAEEALGDKVSSGRREGQKPAHTLYVDSVHIKTIAAALYEPIVSLLLPGYGVRACEEGV